MAAKLKGVQKRVFLLHDNEPLHLAKLNVKAKPAQSYLDHTSLSATQSAFCTVQLPLVPISGPSTERAPHCRKFSDFYEEGIHRVPGRWQDVIDTDGG
ncbi:hypothetical protein RB195_008837 [Necator americanus]|uniref:Tc1-like transposase DDE domain-containing protein n=1 Tax=Necator americanus TaxID=51031 RepID=A0ABR1CQK6_NECAM